VNPKKAIIAGICVYFLMLLLWLMKDTFKKGGPSALTFLSISPLSGIS